MNSAGLDSAHYYNAHGLARGAGRAAMRAGALAQTTRSPGAARRTHRPWSPHRAGAHGSATTAVNRWSELCEVFTDVDGGARRSRQTRFLRRKLTKEGGPRRGGKEEVTLRRPNSCGGSRRSTKPPVSPTALEQIGEGEARSQLRRDGSAGGAHRRGEVAAAMALTFVRGGGFQWLKVDKGCH
jgi:hypothetical protein